ncbi:hypothetical protein [Pseudomonas sp. ITEM 17296]|jgi:hypothetical protein
MSDPKMLTPEERIKELEQQLELMNQKAQLFTAAAGYALLRRHAP